MKFRKTDAFLGDIERQYKWYAVNASGELADRFLSAVEGACQLLSLQPHLGPACGFTNPKLQSWRYFLVLRPFERHILFYEISSEEIILRRAMHGHRDLPKRLLESRDER